MPEHIPHFGGRGRRCVDGLASLLARLVRLAHGAVTGHAGRSAGKGDATGKGSRTTRLGLEGFPGRVTALGPWDRRHMITGLTGLFEEWEFGWVQRIGSPSGMMRLGVFTDRNHFAQVALADGKGRVFMGGDADMDTHGMDPQFMFVQERGLRLRDAARLGGNPAPTSHLRDAADASGAGRAGAGVSVMQGGMAGRDDSGRMIWLASWLRHGNKYTLEQTRTALPARLRLSLDRPDALAIGFLASYMLPRLRGALLAFGSGNIFHRLSHEAPIGAIRRSVRDMEKARTNGMRVSGLEECFSGLMREAGSLEELRGLEAVHGAEPLHLFRSDHSGKFFFTWDSTMDAAAALASLRIEGGLNRFARISAWLERNADTGAFPTEDTVSEVEAAQLDSMLMEDPALMALRGDDDTLSKDADVPDGRTAICRMVDTARDTAARLAADHPDPVADPDRRTTEGGRGEAADAVAAPEDAGGSEWVYRQTLSLLLRRMCLPGRFDTELRSHLAQGKVAIAFTTAGVSLMPTRRYDSRARDWVRVPDSRRRAMGAAYDLRVGMMMAALAFGADRRVTEVQVTIDSLGLEEAVAEQDSAISALMGEALRVFERMRTPGVRVSGAKGDPKDGDVHGEPTLAGTLGAETRPDDDTAARVEDGRAGHGAGGDGPGESENRRAPGMDGDRGDGEDGPSGEGEAGQARGHDGAAYDDDGQGTSSPDDSLDRRFADLMRDVDLDSMVFSLPEDGGHGAETSVVDAGGAGDAAGDGDDPLRALRSDPQLRHLVSVTFTRDDFLAGLRQDGLRDPLRTYRAFGATMRLDGDGGLMPIAIDTDIHAACFAPNGAVDQPELSDARFGSGLARVFGTDDAIGLSIQREDLLHRALGDFHRLAGDARLDSVDKARQAMAIVNQIADPELSQLAPRVGSSLIDGDDTPDVDFTLATQLDADRIKFRDLLFSGRAGQAIDLAHDRVSRLDALFSGEGMVPRYFNSYAERVVYNHLFATPGERTVLIPDNLFYAHMELSDVLAQLRGPQDALRHLNAMVAYAPAYALPHMKLAIQLARNEDWDSARAACLNALRVALDRDDAAFAYYRFAYAEWMRDEFDVAVAAYRLGESIAPGRIAALQPELRELSERADAQCVRVPRDVDEARHVLREHDLPVWPHTQAARIVSEAARASVDNGMFVLARTLSVASARMGLDDRDDDDMAQELFLRSLVS